MMKPNRITHKSLFICTVIITITVWIVTANFAPLVAMAHRYRCFSSGHKTHLGLAMYLQDHDGGFPPDPTWRAWGGLPYGQEDCPEDPLSARIKHDPEHGALSPSYGMNAYLVQDLYRFESKLWSPETTIATFDTNPGNDVNTDRRDEWDPLHPGCTDKMPSCHEGLEAITRHLGAANYVMVDGHAASLRPEQIPRSYQWKDEHDHPIGERIGSNPNGNDGINPSFMTWGPGAGPSTRTYASLREIPVGGDASSTTLTAAQRAALLPPESLRHQKNRLAQVMKDMQLAAAKTDRYRAMTRQQQLLYELSLIPFNEATTPKTLDLRKRLSEADKDFYTCDRRLTEMMKEAAK